MIERTVPWFGRPLVFDRDDIVRAALRAYIESIIAKLPNCLGMPAVELPSWTGDFQRGALLNFAGPDYEVVAWTEVGVVGLALDAWQGPIEQLGLSIDEVTGGPDDVRAAVPDLPEELEPAFVMAVGMLDVGNHGEKLAGAGFWLYGDRGGGTLFVADQLQDAWGADRLAAWGLLRGDRLPHACGDEIHFHPDEPAAVPIQAIIDAVIDRRVEGPTELTAEELATLVPKPSDLESFSGLKRRLYVQRMLQKVGINWPGSPSLPELPRLTPPDRSVCPASSVGRYYAGGEYMVFDRDAIVHAAICAYVENIFARLDPLERHRFPTCIEARWTGDLQRGAFYNGDDDGNYDVVAWTEAGVVGLAYETGFGPIERFGLAVDAVTGGPDDVRAALPELPAPLEHALALAVGMLPKGPRYGEKLAGVGFWLHGDRVEGTLFDDPPAPPNYLPPAPGVNQLKMWGHLRWGWLLRASSRPSPGPVPNLSTEDLAKAELDKARAAPIQTMVDVVVNRALRGPTDLLPDELAMLLPTPPDPSLLQLGAQRLEKVGITWPGSPELPVPPATTIGRTHRLGYLAFDRKAIVRAALRAYVEKIFTWLDPAERHGYPVCDEPSWTGDLQRGAFYNDISNIGACNVVAWTEAGVVGLAYESGFGPIERFGLSVDAVTGGPDDVRAALPELPTELEPALELAVSMLPKGPRYGEKLAGVGFWQHGDRVAGTLFDDPPAPGVRWLAPWGMLLGGRRYFRISQDFSSFIPEMDRRFGAPIHALVDAVVDRRLSGPTELTTDELATLLPVPTDLEIVVTAQRMLQKVGINWPGSLEI